MPSYDELKIYREKDVAESFRELPDAAIAQFLENVRTIVVSGNFPRECFYEVSQLSKLLHALNEDRIKSDVAN